MAAHAGIAPDKLAPVFLEAGPAPNSGGIPIGGQTRVNLPNDHLQYAITWYALAAGLAVIYVLYHRRLKAAEL
jgi:surfeit locus 1 family protein